MDLLEAIRARHSVRRYTPQPLPQEAVAALREEVDACNREYGVRLGIAVNEPTAFSGAMAHYGKFSGVRNYIILAGKPAPDLQERLGVCGARLALAAQMRGLNSCFVALTYKKRSVRKRTEEGAKAVCVLALGYGETQGVPHRSKPLSSLYRARSAPPEWFLRGMECAQLAPTAMNQQKFLFSLEGNTVTAAAKRGFYAKLDLGIAKYFFEVGAGKENFVWG